jgi:hypothetical protein
MGLWRYLIVMHISLQSELLPSRMLNLWEPGCKRQYRMHMIPIPIDIPLYDEPSYSFWNMIATRGNFHHPFACLLPIVCEGKVCLTLIRTEFEFRGFPGDCRRDFVKGRHDIRSYWPVASWMLPQWL